MLRLYIADNCQRTSLTFTLVWCVKPKPSSSSSAMYVMSRHMNGWSVFGVAHTSCAFS